VNAGSLVRRTLEDADVQHTLRRAAAVDVIAAGKAAAPMIAAALAAIERPIRVRLAIGPRRDPADLTALPESVIWYDAGHPRSWPCPRQRSRSMRNNAPHER